FTSGDASRVVPLDLFRDLYLRGWSNPAGGDSVGQRKLRPADRTSDHLPGNLGGRYGTVWLGLQFRAAHGAISLAPEIPTARITRQGRRLVCEAWIAGLGHEPRDSRKPSTSLCGGGCVATSISTLCEGYGHF